MGWIADTFTDGGLASVGYMLEGVHPPEKWDPPTTRLSSSSFSSISLRVFKLPVIAFLHLNRAPTIGPVLLMVRACHHADDLAVTWGIASCYLGNSASQCITPFSRSSAERMRWSHPAVNKRRSAMATQETRELSDDELAIVCGGTIDVVGRGGTQPSSQVVLGQSVTALAQEVQAAYFQHHYALVLQPI